MTVLSAQSATFTLDGIGRWVLDALEYRVLGLFTAAILILFGVWRRLRYKSWPTGTDLRDAAQNLLGLFGGLMLFVVFLFTKPPAVDKLSSTSLMLIGVAVPAFLLGSVLPKLRLLVFPAEFHKAAEMEAPGTEKERELVLSAEGRSTRL